MRRHVEEDEVQTGEQIPAAVEERLFQLVLDTARGMRAGLLVRVRQGLAEPGHGAVQVLQLEIAAGERLVGHPGQGAAIGAGGGEAVQDGEEDGALGVVATPVGVRAGHAVVGSVTGSSLLAPSNGLALAMSIAASGC